MNMRCVCVYESISLMWLSELSMTIFDRLIPGTLTFKEYSEHVRHVLNRLSGIRLQNQYLVTLLKRPFLTLLGTKNDRQPISSILKPYQKF